MSAGARVVAVFQFFMLAAILVLVGLLVVGRINDQAASRRLNDQINNITSTTTPATFGPNANACDVAPQGRYCP